MPIYRLLQNSGFEPEHVSAMADAFEQTLPKLGLIDRADPLVDLVAQKVIEIGQQGERDAARIRDMIAFTSDCFVARGNRPGARRNVLARPKSAQMADVKTKTGGADRRRVGLDQPYEVEDFHQKHKHLSHDDAVQIIRETGGDRAKADAAAEQLRQ
jgi:hypothetical protein